MKKIITLFAVVVGLFAFSSCEGPEGPPGFDGQDGYNGVGTVYENQAPDYYNFTSGNNYAVGFDFPQRLVESDVVLVYRFDGLDNGGRYVWQALPETYYLANGAREFSFKFVFTDDYVNIYLDGNNQANIPARYRLNQIFRIVIVPADFPSSVNTSNYNEVMSVLKLTESQVKKVKIE
jgi:hypothetical protein